ncbi:MAG: LCP family protein [Pygmaiobacter sp.]|nr:LCP family protein [Pygmaiobacter sp.]
MENSTSQQGSTQPSNGRKKGSKNRVVKIVLVVLAALLLLMGIGVAIVYFYLDAQISEGDAGQLTSAVQSTTPELKSKVVHYLVCGIDFDKDDDGRDYSNGLGMTDVIMYVTLDVEKGTMNILQIPRDTYVGEELPTGGTYRLNAIYSHGADEVNRISNLATVLSDDFALPVDHYVTINMDMFRAMFKILGGLEMYVPWDVADEKGNVIPQGTYFLDADHIEWILRQRKEYAQGDLKRLELQQYFYKAMFRTFKSFPMSDVIKVMPTFITYVNTDMSVSDLISLASTFMQMDSSKIGFARCPGGSITRYNGVTGEKESCYGINVENLATLLNNYYRPYADPVPASALGLPVLDEDEFTLGQLNDDLKMMGTLENDSTLPDAESTSQPAA